MQNLGTLLTCRKCGTGVPTTATACTGCGAPLGAPPGAPSAPAAEPTTAAPLRSPASRAPEVPPGLLERFVMEGELGAGGMGVVMLAHDRRLDRQVAIKLIREPSVELAARFESEARLMASLEHENLVRVYDYGIEAGAPYLVLEYVRGRTLTQRLNAGRPTLVETVRLVLDILAGVSAAHARGIIHRDLKPGNVFLTLAGHAKVADFGLALRVQRSVGSKQAERLTSAGMMVGTPGYMAPEVIRGQPAAAAADIYAVGVMMHELLTGQRLYTGDNVIELLGEQCKGNAAEPSRLNPIVPPVLDQLVAKAMAVEPAERISGAELVASLSRWLDQGARLARTQTAGELPPQPYKLLEPYGAADAQIYFGRDGEAAELVELVESPRGRVLFVFGPCGIGKSSLLSAGLLPRLDAARMSAELLVSGPDPARVLREAVLSRATRLKVALPSGENLSSGLLERKPRLVNDLLMLSHAASGKTAVFVLDQLEELFTRNARDSKKITSFFDMVARIAEAQAVPVRLVLSYRSEFRGDFWALEERISRLQRSYQVRELGPDGLLEAIQGPARIEWYHLAYENGLPERLAADIAETARGGRTAALPLLQIICSQLYERSRDTKRADAKLYEAAVGGAQGALQRYVEERLEGAAYTRRGAIARQMLKALTHKEEGGERRSRPLEEDELLAFPDRAGARQTLERLAADHLVIREAAPDGKRVVRLASDVICALVEAWALQPDDTERASRLLDWAHRYWREHGQRPQDLLSGGLLQFVNQHVDAIKGLGDSERKFVAEATARRERRFFSMFLLFGGLILLLVVSMLGVVSRRMTDSALATEVSRVEQGRRMLADALDGQRKIMRAQAVVIASEPKVIAALDTDQATFLDSAGYYAKMFRPDLFLVTDGKGRLMASLPAGAPHYDRIEQLPEWLRNRHRLESNGLLAKSDRVYETVTVPIDVDVGPQGRLTMGFLVGEKLLKSVRDTTSAEVVFSLDGQVVLATLDGYAPGTPFTPSIGPATRIAGSNGHAYLQVSDNEAGPDHHATWTMLRDLEPALEGVAAVQRVMLVLGAAAVLVALAVSWRLTRTVARWT